MKRLLIMTILLVMIFPVSVFAEVDYTEIKDDLEENSSALKLLKLEELQSEVDIYVSNLNAFYAQSRLSKLEESPNPVSGLTRASLNYQIEILPQFAYYESEQLILEEKVLMGSLSLEARNLIEAIIKAANDVYESQAYFEILSKAYNLYLQDLEAGNVTTIDVLNAKVDMIEAEYAMEEKMRVLDNLYLSFNSAYGYDLRERFDFATETKLEAPINDVKAYVEAAFANRIEIRDLWAQIEIQNNIIEFYNDTNYLIYTENREAQEAAAFKVEQLTMDLEIIKDQIQLEIYAAMNTLDQLEAEIKLLANEISSQENHVNVTEIMYNLGEVKAMDLELAQLELVTLENNMDELIFNYNTQRLTLNYGSSYGPGIGGK
ncbi:MAG: TolC family protein [Clostridia bacterium]|nr:TolC family protein [Clostridia bacterium]